ncbi:hypothetical protein CPB85DRAFT_1434972 [Mucidula mucida]|nr:hypothetical protein CPB85DRAFT_1434972 [Mucidula mucida]
MGFFSPLRRLLSYMMSLHTSDNVVPPANHILFGNPEAKSNRSYPMDGNIYHEEFLKYVKHQTTDLTLQSCVTRIDFCKKPDSKLEHEYLVAHIVYWFGGQAHNRYKSFAVIDRAQTGKRYSDRRRQRGDADEAPPASPSASTPPPAPPASPIRLYSSTCLPIRLYSSTCPHLSVRVSSMHPVCRWWL